MTAARFSDASFSAHGLACRRGGRELFSDLDFEIESGGALVLRGRNGAGKTSLLRLAAGLLRPAEGHFAWNGAVIEEYGTQIHFVGHENALKPVFTVRENLSFWARLHGSLDGVGGALEAAELGRIADIPVRFLSEGQRRRAALARLLATPKPLWLLDEPNASLDKGATAWLAEVFESHLAAGGMILAATHRALGLESQPELTLGRTPA